MKRGIAFFTAVLIVCLLAMQCAAAKVQPSKQKTSVDGEMVSCEVYNIDGNNYYKLRDLAYMLNGTSAQFSIAWDAENQRISIRTSRPYDAVGGEMELGTDKSASAVPSAQSLWINEREITGLTVYNIGGNNFFKLRDINEWLYFTVDYNEIANMVAIGSEEISGCAGSC